MTLLDVCGLQRKKAVIIGGGRGMGTASAWLLAEAGMAVSIVDRHQDRAEAVAAKMRSEGHTAISMCADVQQKEQAERAIAQTLEALGDLDAMVNVVGGITVRSELIRLDADQWDAMLSMNLQHHFYCSAAFAGALERAGHGGAAVSISSIAAVEAAPTYAAYGAAKGALVALTKTMAVELGGLGIRVNCIVAGTVETGPSQRTADELARLTGLIPLRRMGTVDDIARAVLFLVSDLSTWITGQALIVDGGITSNPSF
jgi:NAD(P)-dependent dehydrogenase (short-subunit alcohol dehydrogenase family)